MSSMSIGQVAQICGLAPSAIRYYEKAGLLPKPIRVNCGDSHVRGGILRDHTAGDSLANARQT